jgi:hypothetical protein
MGRCSVSRVGTINSGTYIWNDILAWHNANLTEFAEAMCLHYDHRSMLGYAKSTLTKIITCLFEHVYPPLSSDGHYTKLKFPYTSIPEQTFYS